MKNGMKMGVVFGTILMLVFVAYTALALNLGMSQTRETESVVTTIMPENNLGLLEAELAFESEGVSEAALSSASSVKEVIPWWVDIVNAEPVDIPNEGEGVNIAVLDTGLVGLWKNYLPTGNILTQYGKGFTNDITWDSSTGDFEIGPLRDNRGYITYQWGNGHGTAVTGMITGYYLQAFDGLVYVRGVAPKAKIIPVLVEDCWLVNCPDSSYPGCHGGKVLFTEPGTEALACAAGIKYAADLSEKLDGPMVISMSLGYWDHIEELEEAVNYAIEKGCIITVCAMNEGYSGMGYPAAFPQVISCAAGGWTEIWYGNPYYLFWRGDYKDVPEKLNTVDYLGNNQQIYLAGFSSRPNKALGQKAQDLDVTAPGHYVLAPYKNTAYWTGSYWAWPMPSYYWLHGTSFACPITAGIAAIVLSEYPDVEQAEMEKVLKTAAHGLPLSCDGASVYYGNWNYEWKGTDYGAGFIQADAAMKCADSFCKK
jgi:subtilisin family serine protease